MIQLSSLINEFYVVYIVIINKISIQHMWIFVCTIINEFFICFHMSLGFSTNYFFLFYIAVKSSSSLGNDKFLFGMLYINLLNLVWFWSRIWEFYKFWSFKSWDFWYLRLSMLILILRLKCFLFRFMWFFVFLLKAMIFGWLIICST